MSNELKIKLDEYKNDPNIIAILGFGSKFGGDFDQFSDIDIFIITKISKYNRNYLKINGECIDIIFDTIEEVTDYLKEEECSIHRSVSHMIANSQIIFSRSQEINQLIEIAKENLKLPTKFTEEEIWMHIYSIDDFWKKSQRSAKNKDYLAFGLYGNMLIENVIDLTLKKNKKYRYQPKALFDQIKEIDEKLANDLQDYFSWGDIDEKLKALGKIVKYSQEKYGSLPDELVIK